MGDLDDEGQTLLLALALAGRGRSEDANVQLRRWRLPCRLCRPKASTLEDLLRAELALAAPRFGGYLRCVVVAAKAARRMPPPEDMRRRFATPALALLVYVAAMTAFIYGFEHRADADRAEEIGADEVVIISSVALLHVALGAVVGQVWVVAVALFLPALIAVPAGGYPGGWPEGSVASSMLVQEMVYGVPLVVLGLAGRWLFERQRRAGARRKTPRPT